METLEASLKAIEIFNLGISQALHYANTAEKEHGKRLVTNLKGAVDRLNALIEEMEDSN